MDEVTVVPNLQTDTQHDGPPAETIRSRAHIYFKDLSISIHPDDESEEEELIPGPGSRVNSEQLSSPESKGSLTVRDECIHMFLLFVSHDFEFDAAIFDSKD